MLEEHLNSIKHDIKSYINTNKISINTKNPDFLNQLVNSSSSEVKNIFNTMRNETIEYKFRKMI